MDGPHVSLNIQPSSRSSQGTIVIVCISRPRRVRTKCQYAACELDSAFAINLAWTCMSLSALCLVKYLTLELTIAVRSTAHPRFGGRIALSPERMGPCRCDVEVGLGSNINCASSAALELGPRHSDTFSQGLRQANYRWWRRQSYQDGTINPCRRLGGAPGSPFKVR